MSYRDDAFPFVRVAMVCLLVSSLVIIGSLAAIIFMIPAAFSGFGYFDLFSAADVFGFAGDFSSGGLDSEADGNSLIPFSDLWSLQVGFYQTVITFLIAINGLIAAISVIYIKSSSEDKAEEITKKYMRGESFEILLKKKVKEESEKMLRQAQKDFEDLVKQLDFHLEDVQEVIAENSDIKRQLKIVSKRVSMLDEADSEGKEIELKRRGM